MKKCPSCSQNITTVWHIFFLAVTGTGSANVAGEKLIILLATDRYTIKKNFHFYTTTNNIK